MSNITKNFDVTVNDIRKTGNIVTFADHGIKPNAITHGGIFHADEIFATVLLSMFQDVFLLRTFKVPDDIDSEETWIYDIGGGEFDHHQKDAETRENGIKYAAFGLLWRELGVELLSNLLDTSEQVDEAFEKFDVEFVQGIDAIDNGQISKGAGEDEIRVMSVSQMISGFNPNWDEQVDPNERFLDAICVAHQVFVNSLSSIISKIHAKSIVEEAIVRTTNAYVPWIMELEEFVPWQEYLLESKNPGAEEILFVTFPSLRGGWNVQAVPDAPGSFGMRQAMPEEWRGLRGEELRKLTAVDDATFIHPAGFIGGAETASGARHLAQLAGQGEVSAAISLPGLRK